MGLPQNFNRLHRTQFGKLNRIYVCMRGWVLSPVLDIRIQTQTDRRGEESKDTGYFYRSKFQNTLGEFRHFTNLEN